MSSAVCLIEFNKSTACFQVTQSGIEYISQINGPVAVVSITGKFRLGKSSFLNRALLNCSDTKGFTESSLTTSCTIGIWVKAHPNYQTNSGQKVTLLVMDSEGIMSLESKNVGYDLSIITLTCLLSDLVLFNNEKSIDENAIETLSLVTQITNKIKASESDETNDDGQDNALSKMSNFFPPLIWLIRNSQLKPVDDDKQPITSKQYLEQCLREHHDDANKNRIRRQLKTCFKSRDCVLVGQPTINTDELAKLSTIPTEKLHVGYRNGITEFQTKMKQLLKPKKFQNKPVDGSGFASLVQAFVSAINEKENVPNIDDISSSYCKSQIKSQYDKNLKQFKIFIESLKKSAGIVSNPAILKEKLYSKFQELESSFIRSCPESGQEDLIKQFSEEFSNEVDTLSKSYEESNMEKVNLWIKTQVDAFETYFYQNSHETVEKIKEKYNIYFNTVINTLGDANAVLGIWFYDCKVGNKIWDWSKDIIDKRSIQLEANIETLKTTSLELIEMKKQHQLKETQLSDLTLQFQTIESNHKQLSNEYLMLDTKHQEQSLLYSEQQKDYLCNKDELAKQHAEFIEYVQQHGTNINEKETKIAELSTSVSESTILIKNLQESLSVAETELTRLRADVNSINIWEIENQELKEKLSLLESQLETTTTSDSEKEQLFREQIQLQQSEAQEIITYNQKTYEEKQKQYESKLELLEKTIETSKNIHSQELRSLTESKSALNLQVSLLTEENKRLDNHFNNIKQELITSQALLHAKTDEYQQALRELHSKWRLESLAATNKESNMLKLYQELELKLNKQISHLERELAISNTKVVEIEKIFSCANDQAQDTKRLREENKILHVEKTKIETEVQLFRTQNQSLSQQYRTSQQEIVKLEKKISSLESSHAIELSRAQLKSARCPSGSNN